MSYVIIQHACSDQYLSMDTRAMPSYVSYGVLHLMKHGAYHHNKVCLCWRLVHAWTLSKPIASWIASLLYYIISKFQNSTVTINYCKTTSDTYGARARTSARLRCNIAVFWSCRHWTVDQDYVTRADTTRWVTVYISNTNSSIAAQSTLSAQLIR